MEWIICIVLIASLCFYGWKITLLGGIACLILFSMISDWILGSSGSTGKQYDDEGSIKIDVTVRQTGSPGASYESVRDALATLKNEGFK